MSKKYEKPLSVGSSFTDAFNVILGKKLQVTITDTWSKPMDISIQNNQHLVVSFDNRPFEIEIKSKLNSSIVFSTQIDAIISPIRVSIPQMVSDMLNVATISFRMKEAGAIANIYVDIV